MLSYQDRARLAKRFWEEAKLATDADVAESFRQLAEDLEESLETEDAAGTSGEKLKS